MRLFVLKCSIVLVLAGLLTLVIDPRADGAVDLSKLRVGAEVAITQANGGRCEGTVVGLDDETVKVKIRGGVVVIRKTEIRELELKKTPREEYDALAKTAKTADDWCNIGAKMALLGDAELEDKAFHEALTLDPNHAKTHEKLGHVLHEGKWLPLEEARKAQGLENYKGEWLTPEQIAERKAEEAAKLKARKMKGRETLEKEYIGRDAEASEPYITEHYRITCTSTDEVTREYGRIMESLNEKYSMVFQNFQKYTDKAGHPTDGKGVIYIWSNRTQFLDNTGVEMGVGGFYQPWNGDIHAYHGSFGTTGSTYEVLAHEGTHQFQGFILQDFMAAPMWIIEGLAVFFGDGSEYKNGKVEIGLIPRDRLESLQRIFESDALPNMDILYLQPQPFPGFFYAPAWGIIFWCLKGNRMTPKVHDGEGLQLFEEFLLKITKAKGFCDYPAEMERFKKLVEQYTKKDYATWEKEYKQWIMELPLDKLMTKKGSRWVSDKLGFSVDAPSGWKVDRTLRSGEQIAFLATGKPRRISSICDGNDEQADLSEELARRIVDGLFTQVSYSQEPVLRDNVHGYPVVETIFQGVPAVRRDNTAGAQEKPQEATDDTTYKYRVLVYASVDKIRANILEAAPDVFDEANRAFFEKYLAGFQAEN